VDRRREGGREKGKKKGKSEISSYTRGEGGKEKRKGGSAVSLSALQTKRKLRVIKTYESPKGKKKKSNASPSSGPGKKEGGKRRPALNRGPIGREGGLDLKAFLIEGERGRKGKDQPSQTIVSIAQEKKKGKGKRGRILIFHSAAEEAGEKT